MSKELWCTFLKNVDQMEREMENLCSMLFKKRTCCLHEEEQQKYKCHCDYENRN